MIYLWIYLFLFYYLNIIEVSRKIGRKDCVIVSCNVIFVFQSYVLSRSEVNCLELCGRMFLWRECCREWEIMVEVKKGCVDDLVLLLELNEEIVFQEL